MNEKDFEKIYALMECSFPIEEVRPQENAKAQLRDPHYTIWISRNEADLILAFIAEWDLGSIIFLEHFAVEQTLRGGGIGSRMMAAYLSQAAKPVVIEVEDVKTEISERRIGFYQRLGFHLSEYGYDQPVMRGDISKKIPLKMMTYPDPLSAEGFEHFRQQVFSQIYKITKT
ncbi:GNAT family N-acetyltransferase [Acetobacterium sp.]|uniref:GNAT family N-acetyltransferase n=1 Tax=Acetobacterium sp. TaxID=1872094 RepID=UPI000CBBE918|nr:GNAT family N-acetyltransferase [Acetobacterium sp.]MDO9492768.1 GNAT family N-acetyltransferase [Acetobacterium sp.]PKM74640.1 MAG: GNAT family N-acetyltransferase [Firmicutes bacterium HGW-Firmicutes-17]